MKKTKQISLVRTLIAATLLLIGSSGGVAWGQAYIGTPGNNVNGTNTDGTHAINNQFGAGESATINGRWPIIWPTNNYSLLTPWETPPIQSIYIGSDKNNGMPGDGRNIVINSYNGQGLIQGWVRQSWGKNSHPDADDRCGTTAHANAGTPTYNYTNAQSEWTDYPGTGSGFGPGARTYSWSLSGDPCNVPHCNSGCGSIPRISGSYSYDAYRHFRPYTNHNVDIDDGTPLVQLTGRVVNSTSTYNTNANSMPALTVENGLTYYRRPTTVAIGDSATYKEFKITPIQWWYVTFNVHATASNILENKNDVRCHGNWWTYNDCGTHSDTNHDRDAWTSVGSHHIVYNVSWVRGLHDGGASRLDAAIQLLRGADVCITEDITDAAGVVQSKSGGTTASTSLGTGDSETDALLVWPETGNNFRLTVGGNFNAMNMKHEGSANNLFYESDKFPKNAEIQNSAATDGGYMYLYKGAQTFPNIVDRTDGLNATYTNIPLPYHETTAGILGVKGNYSALNSYVHTLDPGPGNPNNHGVIMVGGATQGQQRFKIYSGGTIKNFVSRCVSNPCGGVSFSTGNTPDFIFNNTESLNILNDGSCCSSSITFADADAIKKITDDASVTPKSGVKNATNTGDLLIRAHGHVELGAPANFQPAQQNNISILSDSAYITTKDFTHTAAGGADKGHLTLWAKGLSKPNPSSPNCGGYIMINGDLTTTSTGAASTWQNLHAALDSLPYSPTSMNSENLARSTKCTDSGEEMAARKSGSLNTQVQTRIQSDNDYIYIDKDFKHKGKDGGLLVQAAGSVTVNGKTDIDFAANAGEGDAVIQSRASYVNFIKDFTYKGHEETDLFIDGETGVNFKHGTSITYGQTIEAPNIGIQSNAGTIAFSGAPFKFDYKPKGKTQLWAGDSITSTAEAPLTFNYEKAASGQDIDWYAGKGIRLNGTLTFNHDNATDHTGFIKLRANTNDSVLWNELPFTTLVKRPGETRCPQQCGGSGTVGDIFLNADVNVNYQGKQDVWMSANNDIHVRRNYTHVAGGGGQVGQGYTRFVAGHDIVTGEAGVPAGTTGSTFSYLHKGDRGGNFDMKAGNDIITHNKVDIKYAAAAKDALVTTLSACQNIDIRNLFWYSDNSGTSNTNKWTRLYAKQSILSNSQCLTQGAPINFYTNDNTLTEWNAGRNIITGDSVNFRYGNTSNQVRNLALVAQGGNIEMKRWTNIDYDSKDTILISAERNKKYSKAKAAGLTTAGGANPNVVTPDVARFTDDGHIYFNDSLNITRNNADHSTEDGVTNIFADYHIRTAMVNLTNTEATNRNKTTIESHLGDIWLGYSVAPDACPNPHQATDVSYDNNLFHYKDKANTDKQSLKIRAGYQDQANTGRYGGGNIYIVQMKNELTKGGTTNTEITIPFSNEYYCGSTWSSGLLHNRQKDTMMMYEHAGIIFGLGHCGIDKDISKYAPAQGTGSSVSKISLTHLGNKGNLLVDAGKRGNIIVNKGAKLNFQDPSSTGNAIFRTRTGDIDMRDPFNVDSMVGSLLFLAQIDNLSDLSKIGICGCDEERNNVYLQDFQYLAHEGSGSVFVGADNNIKLNYGGLQNIGTRHDPFLSKDYKLCSDGRLAKIGYGYHKNGGCDSMALHCDAVEPENQARPLVLNFEKDGGGKAITKGGFAAVASDYIDVYKKLEYRGGRGSGMSSVPGTGTLHGETVNGYGLFMKTQANKNNWTINIFHEIPKCPTTCAGENCDRDYLHLVSRMTFHDDADIQAQNQKVMLWSPVIETYGKMTLDTKKNSGNNTEITLKADSLIFHDDFVKIGNKTKLSTWSGLKNDKPVMKFGHMRHKPPFVELKYDDCRDTIHCAPCHYYIRGSKDPLHMMDTITIKFGDDAYLERLNTVVFDHTVLTCLTDSFDHIKGAPVLNAQIRTDTLKIRNQVDLFADKNHERDAHLELISERQMGSKDYAGIYTKHLHMEPIGACETPYSELWTSDDLALDVITTSIFGGFGFIHSDVHVENGAHLNAGFTSLRLRGLCYEQLCGTQRMKDLRLDVGAQLHFSVGTKKGLNGEYSDAIEVEKLTTYGSVDVNIEVRPCEKMEKRCYPIIYYKSLTPNSLNNLKVKPAVVKIDGEEYPLHLNIGTDGIVYVCVGDAQPVDLTRTVTIPSVTGVTTDPVPGIWEVKSRGNFKFKATFSGTKPLAVRTSRMVNGAPEMLTGKKNVNGEYEYVIPHVQEDITLTIGPDFVANELLAGTAVWSHGEMIYIRVDRADIASIYSVAGQLVRKIDLPEGDTSIPMSRGAYVITLKDGSVHKVIVK